MTDPLADGSAAGEEAVRALLDEVAITVSSQSIVVANRLTGGEIFRGPVANPAAGTFQPKTCGGRSRRRPS